MVYLDDIIVPGCTFQDHLMRLDGVLEKLQQANLKVKPSKCNLISTQVHYLGHVISAEGVMLDPSKVEAVREWPVLKNQTEVQSIKSRLIVICQKNLNCRDMLPYGISCRCRGLDQQEFLLLFLMLPPK